MQLYFAAGIYCLHGKLAAIWSFTTPEVMWMLIMKLPHTEVKFYPEVKSQTGLSSLRVSCKGALNLRARLHETRSELKPIWKLKPLWHLVPFTWQFTKWFHCGIFPNNSKTLLHRCKWYLLINANLINAKRCSQW